jgi:hypothetical protein
MSEIDVRVQILNTFLATPHGKLDDLALTHIDAIERDPLFYGHLSVWYGERGEVRDHKVLFVAHLLTSEYPEHREAGWVLLQQLPPHMIAAVLDHAKAVIGKSPRILKNAVATFLRSLEGHPNRFDRAALRSRQALKHLYASLRIKPGDRAQCILFEEMPPEDSPLHMLKLLARAQDPEEQALLIIVHRIPYTTAVGAIRQITPSILVALIDVMTPQELINHMKALSRHGAWQNDEVKQIVEEKLRQAESDKRVSTLKATRAIASADLQESTRAVLTEVTDRRVAQMARIDRATALFVDKSGSMSQAITVAQEVAALVSAVCSDFHVLMFDTVAHAVPTPAETTRSGWEAAFRMYKANGGTSIGAPLARLEKQSQRVEEIVIVTDGEENSAPFFKGAYESYVRALGVSPHVVVVAVGGTAQSFVHTLEEAAISATHWAFEGDYYSLPNLLPLLALPTRADLVEQIMAVPLPTRGAGWAGPNGRKAS